MRGLNYYRNHKKYKLKINTYAPSLAGIAIPTIIVKLKLLELKRLLQSKTKL